MIAQRSDMTLTWDSAIKMWRDEMSAAGASAGTIQLRMSYIYRFMRVMDAPANASRGDLVAWLGHFTWGPETRRSARSSLVSFYRWAYDEGHIEINPAARLPRVRVPVAVPRPAPDEAIRRAIDQAEARVRLMLMLAAVAGMRRTEISRVHTGDLTGRQLTVHGKGGKDRMITLPESLAITIRARPAGWLFPGVHGHLCPAHVGTLMTRVLRVTRPAGDVSGDDEIEDRLVTNGDPRDGGTRVVGGYTPHQLRHAAASYLNEIGLSMFDIRDFLGHASVATTQRYVAIRNSATAAAIETAAARFAA